MKKLLTFAAGMLLVAACKTTDKPLAGGFDKSSKPTAEEMQLFKDVVLTDNDIDLTPVKVSRQVVAGTNYRFECVGKDKKKVEVVVHQPLPGNGRARILSDSINSR